MTACIIDEVKLFELSARRNLKLLAKEALELLTVSCYSSVVDTFFLGSIQAFSCTVPFLLRLPMACWIEHAHCIPVW